MKENESPLLKQLIDCIGRQGYRHSHDVTSISWLHWESSPKCSSVIHRIWNISATETLVFQLQLCLQLLTWLEVKYSIYISLSPIFSLRHNKKREEQIIIFPLYLEYRTNSRKKQIEISKLWLLFSLKHPCIYSLLFHLQYTDH